MPTIANCVGKERSSATSRDESHPYFQVRRTIPPIQSLGFSLFWKNRKTTDPHIRELGKSWKSTCARTHLQLSPDLPSIYRYLEMIHRLFQHVNDLRPQTAPTVTVNERFIQFIPGTCTSFHRRVGFVRIHLTGKCASFNFGPIGPNFGCRAKQSEP